MPLRGCETRRGNFFASLEATAMRSVPGAVATGCAMLPGSGHSLSGASKHFLARIRLRDVVTRSAGNEVGTGSGSDRVRYAAGVRPFSSVRRVNTSLLEFGYAGFS